MRFMIPKHIFALLALTGTTSAVSSTTRKFIDEDEVERQLLVPFDPSWNRRILNFNHQITDTTYQWIDISSSGATPFANAGSDVIVNDYALSADFPFYGVMQSQVNIDGNGFLCFGETDISGANWNNQCLPNTNNNKDACIFVFWDDLDPGCSCSSTMFYEYQNSCTHPYDTSLGCHIFTWEDTHDPGTANASVEAEFQAILFDSGDIVLQYKTIGIHANNVSPTVGIQGYGGSDPEQHVCAKSNAENTITAASALLIDALGFPSSSPSNQPSSTPSDIPSSSPSDTPSSSPSDKPSSAPSDTPSSSPSDNPSSSPSDEPSSAPSDEPSSAPSDNPSSSPSDIPSSSPSDIPSSSPSDNPSSSPSDTPSSSPSVNPTSSPSDNPSSSPSDNPSSSPSDTPSSKPSKTPSSIPSFSPSSSPSLSPTATPSADPTGTKTKKRLKKLKKEEQKKLTKKNKSDKKSAKKNRGNKKSAKKNRGNKKSAKKNRGNKKSAKKNSGNKKNAKKRNRGNKKEKKRTKGKKNKRNKKKKDATKKRRQRQQEIDGVSTRTNESGVPTPTVTKKSKEKTKKRTLASGVAPPMISFLPLM